MSGGRLRKILPTPLKFGNTETRSHGLARLVFPEATREFRIEVDLLVEMAVFDPFNFFLEPGAARFPSRGGIGHLATRQIIGSGA